MKHKTIGTTSAELLTQLHEQGKDFFRISDAASLLGDKKEPIVRNLLGQMTKRGLLLRLRDGLYHIIPYDRDPAQYFPDWNVAAHFLAGETPYYIAYFSALVLHDLTTQPALMQQIAVAKPLRPTEQRIGGIPFRFTYHNPAHFFGATRKWVQGIYPVQVSDLEKTMLDCAFNPANAGGITELAKAIFKAKDRLQGEKLLEYVRRFDSDAAARRLGFLLETLEILPETCADLQKHLPKTATYVPLDTALPKFGKTTARWGIIQNLDIETIQTSLFN